MNPALAIEDMSRQYGKLEAVHHLDLTVPRGSLYALLGPNGAGKTTTIHVVMNLIPPSSGRAFVFGADSTGLGPRELAQIGYVSENQKLPGWMTVAQLLAFCKPLYGTWDDDLCRKLVRTFDLPLDRKVRSLSRGMRQKAAMITALAFHPRLLVLDEPFSGLDVSVREELVEGMLELAGRDEWTLFISSQDLEEIENLVDRVGFLSEGKLLLSEDLEQLQDRLREIEVTLPADAQAPRISDDWPAAWLSVQVAGNVVRFTDSRYQERECAALIQRIFPQAAAPEITPLSLRSIFITLARQAARLTAKEV
jgi:ABC-2 type transport system ATP-binding protein